MAQFRNFPLNIIIFLLVRQGTELINSQNSDGCRTTLDDKHIKHISWTYLKQCLRLLNGEIMTKATSQNIWKLTKLAFGSIENIPEQTYKYLGYALREIPSEELKNITLAKVEIVEAFGLVRSSDQSSGQQGFNETQLTLLASKLHTEWLGKNPQTYSEYDLQVMGEILCYLNISDIEKIQGVAFREAAEWIGMLTNCPYEALEALAKVAKKPEAFGEPKSWLALEISILGNILNGLEASELNAIDRNKLKSIHYNKPRPGKTNFQTNKANISEN